MTRTQQRPEDFTFATPEVNACPYPFYEAVREHCPVYPIPGQGIHLVGRYSDVCEAAQDTSRFSSHRPVLGAGDPEFEEIAKQGYPEVPSLVTNDPPEHTRFRKIVNQGFTPRAVRALEPAITAIADELIDDLVADDTAELMSRFAMPFPTRVIGNALGVPTEDHGRFQEWADAIADIVSTFASRERLLDCRRQIVDMQHYFARLIDERRKQPTEDLVSVLVNARVGGERPLDVPEMLDVIRIFVAGGVESTASLIGSAMYLLLTHPDQLREVQADYSLIPSMLEEALRMESPVQFNPRMIEKDDVRLAGVALEPGTRVLLGWGPGNRDPEKFGPDADQFDIHRKAGQHLALGHGVHFCIGAPLARSEARIAFERLFTRLKNIELAVPADEIRYVGAFVRRLERLPLRFDVT